MSKCGWRLVSLGLCHFRSPGLLKVLLHELETGYAGEFNAVMDLSWIVGGTVLHFYKLALAEITQAVKANETSSNE